MLRGPSKITLDAKGRLSIPTKYRDQIVAQCDGQLICTVEQRGCLLLYPLPDWEETERKLIRLPSLNETAQKLKGLLMGYATELEMDGHGRVLGKNSRKAQIAAGEAGLLALRIDIEIDDADQPSPM